MKKWLQSTLLLTLVTLTLPVFANYVVVKGWVKYPNGAPAANFSVGVRVDTVPGTATCINALTATTNPNGVYETKFDCPYNILKVTISYKNCDGKMVYAVKEVPATGTVEYNITLCTPTACKADYVWSGSNTAPLTFQFNSTSAIAGAGDEIIGRVWAWGDNTANTEGNVVSPTHAFSKPGTYQVCLRIATRNGCVSYLCQQIVIPNPTNCKPNYTFTVSPNSNFTYQFNSSSSAAGAGDSIVSRAWFFGDNTSITSGNEISPSHTFANAGTYNVCLKIITKYGCQNYFCQSITVTTPPTNCKANYVWANTNTNPLSYYFNSSTSVAGTGDSIISRVWAWGDNTSLSDGNVVQPTHTFSQPGTYQVCLRIATKKGCVSYSCQQIVVVNPTACKPGFSWTVSPNSSLIYQFNSSASAAGAGDSIKYRVWYFGDSTSITSGNEVSPTHTYAKPGTYNVCLKIVTKYGCQNYFCQTITVVAPPTNCKANYVWYASTSAANPLYYYFNSSTSSAGDGDSIISRIWAWGDNTLVVDGNLVSTTHMFAAPGTYNVCLRIATKRGCVSYSCQQIIVPAPVPDCKPEFEWTKTSEAYYFTFNSGPSMIAPGDSIIKRTWSWGDGSANTVGNFATVSHRFPGPGTYEVCLAIVTKKGCEKKVCKPFVVAAVCNTKADFTYALLPTMQPAGYNVKFNSAASSTTAPDSIIFRHWTFGDGAVLDGNVVDPTHLYLQAGVYKVCLIFKTKNGCYSTETCKEVNILPATGCESIFKYEQIPSTANIPPRSYFRFNSTASHPAPLGDSIISRTWTFGDGASLTTKDAIVTHGYEKAGMYNVCLSILTARGCQSKNCMVIVVNAPQPPPCKPDFTFIWDGPTLKLNAGISQIAVADSIVKYYWSFGDGQTASGNLRETKHTYQQRGQYEVCLQIVTRYGCEQKICKWIPATPNDQAKCGARFVVNASGPFKLKFNSSASFTQIDKDSIIRRYWDFGDGNKLGDNVVDPSHEYRLNGSYTVCLTIITAKGCENRWCQTVYVTGNLTNSDTSYIRIVSTYPNPARGNFYAVIWSRMPNVKATVSIYDVYGQLKWTMQTSLPQGNSTWGIPTATLLPGPYILQVITPYGIRKQAFMKVY